MKLNGGKIVVEALREQGAKVVFGIPGGQTLGVTDALMDSGIRFIPVRHEGAAGHAADGYGRLTGEPGYCLATTGPGATNLLTPLGGALRDSSPVIAMVFQNRNSDFMRANAQCADHGAIFASLCKKYIPVHTADAVAWAMREAYRTAVSGRKGPVVVDFFRDAIEEQTCDFEPVDRSRWAVPADCAPSAEAIREAAALVLASKKTVLYAGNGVKAAKAGEALMRLSELLDAPVVTSFNGIASVPGDFANCFGARSRHGSTLTRSILEEADLVLAFGTSLSAVATNRWQLRMENLVQFDLEAGRIGQNYPVRLGVTGDLRHALPMLAAELERAGCADPARGAWLTELRGRRDAWRAQVFAGPRADAEASPAAPAALMAALDAELREGSVFCCDAGNPGAWAHLLTMRRGMRFMKTVNFGNMGFSIPAAEACALAEPGTEVIAMLGDGSLGMELGELETLSRLGLKVIILLLNDAAYGNIKQEEIHKFGPGRCSGVDLSRMDYSAVARAMGCAGLSVSRACELPAALARARETDGPVLINVAFDGSYSVWPEAF